ncbi:VPLPA-CTERM protein sorting domain-containing protein [Duganella sp. CF402]|uniref:PEP-CTERM sorting domain-containing protein n=1 Tax=unclassified Duganella TaxID=2636909 RepID=UPI0008ABE8D0|nr:MULTISPECIES: PEP-CTERM sorting domain-containing protein [unclassified Duganella]RZT10422.1 putative secreted protein [Duganella sp. BK701]SEL13778.1 VPLPA-CTERM protein sorting domain-containing protein [Duganella sp. CF402]
MKNILSTAVLSAVTLFGAQSAMADVTVSGDYLKFGVGDNGALIDFGLYGWPVTGLQFDPSGTGNFSGAPDFLTPGTPFAFFSLGVNSAVATAGGGGQNNPFSSTTATLSNVGTTYVFTSGGTYAGLNISQTITFDTNSNIIHTDVVLTNKSNGVLSNVTYAAGLDPDQDATCCTYSTINTIGGQGMGAEVTALGAYTGLSITMSNTSGWAAVASISGWETNPYTLSGAVIDYGNGDNTIALGYKFGDMAKNQQIAIGYDYTVAAVPEPATYGMLLAGLGAVGAIARRRKQA